jgi:hypothetical protein
MSLVFDATRIVRNASPSPSTAPVTMCAWAMPALGQTGPSVLNWNIQGTDVYSIFQNNINWSVYAGGADFGCGAATAGKWSFLVVRFLASTIRGDTLLESGAIGHGSTTSGGVAATSWSIGSGYFNSALLNAWQGAIEQFTIFDVDIYPSGNLDDALLHQLAYRGPFSIPHLAKNIVEYRSLRSGIDVGSDNSRDVYQRTRQVWTQTGNPPLGPPAPALPYRGPPGSRSARVTPA